MVTDGILDAGRTKIQDDIMVKLRTWYVKQIYDKVTNAGIPDSTIDGWKTIMDNADEKSIRKNGKLFDLIDAESFNLALTKYDEMPHVDIEDSNFFIIYLIPDNLYPIEDKGFLVCAFRILNSLLKLQWHRQHQEHLDKDLVLVI